MEQEKALLKTAEILRGRYRDTVFNKFTGVGCQLLKFQNHTERELEIGLTR